MVNLQCTRLRLINVKAPIEYIIWGRRNSSSFIFLSSFVCTSTYPYGYGFFFHPLLSLDVATLFILRQSHRPRHHNICFHDFVLWGEKNSLSRFHVLAYSKAVLWKDTISSSPHSILQPRTHGYCPICDDYSVQREVCICIHRKNEYTLDVPCGKEKKEKETSIGFIFTVFPLVHVYQ